jgi:hypothetical protein
MKFWIFVTKASTFLIWFQKNKFFVKKMLFSV